MCYYTFLNEKLLQRYTFFMIYAYKTSKFAKKILSNCLILQFSATKTILFCIFCNYKLHKNEAPEVLAPCA